VRHCNLPNDAASEGVVAGVGQYFLLVSGPAAAAVVVIDGEVPYSDTKKETADHNLDVGDGAVLASEIVGAEVVLAHRDFVAGHNRRDHSHKQEGSTASVAEAETDKMEEWMFDLHDSCVKHDVQRVGNGSVVEQRHSLTEESGWKAVK